MQIPPGELDRSSRKLSERRSRYLIAAEDPRRHWPIVLVGLLGKVFGPIGFAVALAKGTFPPVFGLTILTNDLVWWVPFGLILWGAARRPNPAGSGT